MNAMSTFTTGYCTNVHAGRTLDETRANLERHALAVTAFGNWLTERGLVPYTLNGFPYGDFHQQVVKHRVYEPTWWQPERLHYTMQLAQILDAILPTGLEGSISTLPIAWGAPCPSRE